MSIWSIEPSTFIKQPPTCPVAAAEAEGDHTEDVHGHCTHELLVNDLGSPPLPMAVTAEFSMRLQAGVQDMSRLQNTEEAAAEQEHV